LGIKQKKKKELKYFFSTWQTPKKLRFSKLAILKNLHKSLRSMGRIDLCEGH
jgi:hypothetical protein